MTLHYSDSDAARTYPDPAIHRFDSLAPTTKPPLIADAINRLDLIAPGVRVKVPNRGPGTVVAVHKDVAMVDCDDEDIGVDIWALDMLSVIEETAA